jgi:hypothetical protein
VGSRTCGSLEPRAGDGANFGGRPIRESVKGLVRESHVNTFMNRQRSQVKVVVPKSPGLECELVADFKYVTLGIFPEPEGVSGM